MSDTDPKRRTRTIALDRFLPYRLSVLSNVISGSIATIYRERHGLTIPEWRVLAVLAREPGLSASDVAGRTAMDKVAVSRAVARLLRARRIRRRMADDDRRRSVLQLAPAGEAVYNEVAPWALEYERALLAALSPAETVALDAILSRLLLRARELEATDTHA